MKVRISPLIIVIAFVAAYTRMLIPLTMAYTSVTLHESAHLVAALCIGLRPEEINLSPFGAHLSLKNKLLYSFTDEIILYASGPFLNGMIAIISLALNNLLLYKINISLMIVNLIPIVPLDGGIILKKILLYKIGLKHTSVILSIISAILSSIFLIFCVYDLYNGYINLSMFSISIFLFGNIITSKELNSIDLITSIKSKKRTNKARFIILEQEHNISDILKEISPSYTTIALKIENEHVIMIPESEIINEFTNNS